MDRNPEEIHRRWHKLKDAASRAIARHGGSISYHHGVGTDHKVYLQAENGELAILPTGLLPLFQGLIMLGLENHSPHPERAQATRSLPRIPCAGIFHNFCLPH